MTKPPPGNLRCQVYSADLLNQDIEHRCANTGTHWINFGVCGCDDPHTGLCEEAIQLWVCDGPCDFNVSHPGTCQRTTRRVDGSVLWTCRNNGIRWVDVPLVGGTAQIWMCQGPCNWVGDA